MYSPLAAGPNGLLKEGAALIGGAADALELLYGRGDDSAVARHDREVAHSALVTRLQPRLRRVLAQVGAGSDTAEKLVAEGSRLDEVLLALSELELLGFLARGDGARYVPREPVPREPVPRERVPREARSAPMPRGKGADPRAT